MIRHKINIDHNFDFPSGSLWIMDLEIYLPFRINRKDVFFIEDLMTRDLAIEKGIKAEVYDSICENCTSFTVLYTSIRKESDSVYAINAELMLEP